jgi:hypothetical protein
MTPKQFVPSELDHPASLPNVDATPVPATYESPDVTASSNKMDQMVGRFLRSFHVLLRAVRLYQRNHPRMTESLEATDRNLRAVLAQVPALSIRIERDGLIATTREAPSNHRALPDLRGELRTLAVELAGTGIASLVFLRRANLGELAQFAHAVDAASRSANRASTPRTATDRNWVVWLAEHQISGIQINASVQRREDALLAVLLGALSGPEPADQASDDGPLTSTADQARAALHFLTSLMARLELAQDSPQEAARAVRAQLAGADSHTLALLARAVRQDPPLEGDAQGPYLSRIADALAVEFARAEYLARRVGAGEVRDILAGLESRSGHNPAEEARIEARVERFWSSLPAREKSRVLSGSDAWCLPVPILRAYLEPLLAAAEHKRAEAAGGEARRALVAFTRCLQSEKEAVRRTVAAGLLEMSDLLPRLWPHAQLAGLATEIVAALVRESSMAVGVLLATATETLARLALERRCYAEFEEILSDLEKSPASARELTQPLARRLLDQPYWIPLMDAALANRPLDPTLPRLLQRDPTRLLDRLGLLLTAPEGPSALPAMARLVRAMDEAVLRALETDLCGTRRQRIATAIKLLSAAAPERLATALPRALTTWDWNLQDLAVTELARQPHPGLRSQVARMFLDLLKDAHLHVVPGMIDLIALANEDSAVPRLIEMATGEMNGAQDTFIRIKAIEALGRLGATSAAPRLRELADKRAGLTYVHPAGLRSAAEEALGLLEDRPGSARLYAAQETTEKSSLQFPRPRRYLRVALPSPLPASIEGPRGASARVRAIALGGALLETGSRLAIGDSMSIEIHTGLGRIRSTAVVRNTNPTGYGIEFVHMQQEDREKLRRRLVKLLR